MPTQRPEPAGGRKALDVLVGEWTEQVLLPEIPPGRVGFEWALDGTYLIQRSDIPRPEFPDSIVIIAYDGETDSYTQHYFNSRGVVRIYKMGLRAGVWTLLRDKPDFSPLSFTQRFEARFSADGERSTERIVGASEADTVYGTAFDLGWPDAHIGHCRTRPREPGRPRVDQRRHCDQAKVKSSPTHPEVRHSLGMATRWRYRG